MSGPGKIEGPSPPDQYRCPGENYTISRAIHLGRLVQGYHGCRDCPWADDTDGLSERQIRQLAEVRARPAPASLFYSEGVASATLDGLSPLKAASIGRAFAICLRNTTAAIRAPDQQLTIVVANNGRASTAALHAALCEGVRSGNAAVLDAGPASAACLVRALEEHAADGGVLLGTPSGFASGVGIKFWAGAIPQSQSLLQGELLDAFLKTIEKAIGEERPALHHFGPLNRIPAADAYLDALRPLYHALRPLRLVLGTTCRPIERYLDELTQSVSCKIALRDRPIARLAEQIENHQAHLAMEIDDDGESCRVWNEQAEEVRPESLLAWIATSLAADVVVLEATASPALADHLATAGVRTIFSDPSRQAMAQAMQTSAAQIGGGPSGRLWYAGLPQSGFTAPIADALQTLTFIFNLLSRSDRPLSAVVGSLQ